MKDPVNIFGCWRGFQFGAAWQHPRTTNAGRLKMPIAALPARIRKLIPGNNDPHYDEILRGLGIGDLRSPVTPMSDRELSRAVADFIKDAPSAAAVSRLGRRFNPSSGI